ncbi:MAG: cytochrome c family protein [Proteobacteria bacterium]|nr:cytochrome c family protein [Pseudomonadota bacterium]MBU1710430.1 cytochrome c family protein [Pseudomonadota bacterium]
MKKMMYLFDLVAVLIFSTTAFGDNVTFQVDREFYPYYPSLIKWEKSKAPFTAPRVCGECHPDQYEEWRGSMHALAFHDPVYQGELNKAFQEVGHGISRQCEGCHSPAGVVTEEIKGPGISGLSEVALAGVSCDMCHSINGITHWQTPSHEPENGSFIMSPGYDSDTKEGYTLTKYSPFDSEKFCGIGHHECRKNPLFLQAELCASCHQVYHYESHFPFESTYLEWKHGPYAQKDIVCQDCHMVETETFLRSADNFQKPWRNEYKHYFNGANYLLYFLAGKAAEKSGDQDLVANLAKKYEMAVARLQAAAGLEITPIYLDKTITEIRVRVKNLRAGHNLPTSLTSIRQMWLELIITDQNGKTLLESGMLDDDGQLRENTRIFNSSGMDDNFHFAVDPWMVTSFSRNDTIKPRGYRDVNYGVRITDETVELNVKASLRYRQADQKLAEKILGHLPESINLEKIYGVTEVPKLPIVDMVSEETVFKAKN